MQYRMAAALFGRCLMLMPYKQGLGQGHNQKKDTHPLDFDVTLNTGMDAFTAEKQRGGGVI